MAELITGDRDETGNEKIPVVLVLDRLRSAHNVGNIFRLADAVHLEAVYTCGYTATPPHPKLEKTAMGTDQFVTCEHFEHSLEAVQKLQSEGYKVYAVDTVEGAEDVHQVDFSGKCAFVFGNEALSIQQETLEACDAYVRLEARGLKNSINVSNCAAVVLFRAASQLA